MQPLTKVMMMIPAGPGVDGIELKRFVGMQEFCLDRNLYTETMSNQDRTRITSCTSQTSPVGVAMGFLPQRYGQR